MNAYEGYDAWNSWRTYVEDDPCAVNDAWKARIDDEPEDPSPEETAEHLKQLILSGPWPTD